MATYTGRTDTTIIDLFSRRFANALLTPNRAFDVWWVQ